MRPGTTALDGRFRPGLHYFVGGNTKVYGGALFRLRHRTSGKSFTPMALSPAWPVGYDEFEPYYTAAEDLFHVHGLRGEDPTEPLGKRTLSPIRRSATSPASRRSATHWNARATIHSLCRSAILLGRGRGWPCSRNSLLHPLQRVRRLSLPHQRQGRRAGHLRRSRRCGLTRISRW